MIGKQRAHFSAAAWLAFVILTATIAVALQPAARAAADSGGSSLVYLPQAKLFDTRTGDGGAATAPMASGATETFQVTGRQGVPKDPAVTAVVLVVSAINRSGSGSVKLFPAGSPEPSTTDLLYGGGSNTTNTDIVTLDPSGAVSVTNRYGTADVAVSIQGYFTTNGSTATGNFTPVSGMRLVDTRNGTGYASSGPLPSGSTIRIPIAGVNGLPNDTSDVVVNLSSINASSSGTFRAWATGATEPSYSVSSFDNTAQSSSVTTVPVGSDGSITIRAMGASTNVMVDVQGYFERPAAGSTQPFISSSGRIYDSRSSGETQLAAGETRTVPVFNASYVNAPTLAVHVGVLNATAGGGLRVWPDGASEPSFNQLNFTSGQASSLQIVAAGSNGAVDVKNNTSAPVDIVVDLQGWFLPSGTGYNAESGQTLLDTTTATPLAAGEARNISVGGTSDLPQYGVGGAILDVQARNYTSSGTVGLFSTGWQDPGLAAVAFNGNSALAANTVLVRPGSQGLVTIQNNSSAPIDVSVRLRGWFTAPRAIASADQANFLSQTESLGAPADVANQAVYWQDLADALPATVDSTASPDDTSTVDMNQYTDDDVSQPSADPTVVNDAVGDVTTDQADDLGSPSSSSGAVSPDSAATGTCVASSGYHIWSAGRTLNYRGYLWPHHLIFTVRLKSRWCANSHLNRIGTSYMPKPVVDTTFLGGFAWKVPSLSDIRADRYFNGPSDSVRSGRRAKFAIPMQFCAGPFKIGCTTRMTYVGEQDTWNGYYLAWKSSTF